MENLLSLLNDKYEQICKSFFWDYKIVPFDSLIKDGNECSKFIRSVLKDEDINQINESGPYYQFAKDRSTHAVLTYLIGLIFFDFNNLQQKIADMFQYKAQFRSEDVYRLWMVTSLYHDWGYTSKYLEKPNYKFHVNYDLLTDSYSDNRLNLLINYSNIYSAAFAHSYTQIKAYDRYSRIYHLEHNKGKKKTKTSKKPAEMIDHGILGGVLIFDRLIQSILKSNLPYDKGILMAKTACITIAQHNIFKSDSVDSDLNYRLYSNSNDLEYLYYNNGFSVGIDTPLLLLMCLVDTIECIKRFAKSEIGTGYLQAKTILNNIDVQVTNDQIYLDYSKLLQYIQKEKDSTLKEAFTKYIDRCIIGLNTWTDINVKPTDKDPIQSHFVLTLTYNNTKNKAAVSL